MAGAGVSGSGLGQQRLQEARRGQIVEEFLSQTREQVAEREVSRTKVYIWLGREEKLPSPRWGRQPCDIPPQAVWGRNQLLFVRLCCPRRCSPEY